MGVGNPGTATANQGQMGPGQPAPECKQLDEANTEKREELKGETKDKSVIGPSGKGRGTTVASCRTTGGGPPRVRTAHSNQKACDKCPGSFESGGNDAVRKGDKKGMCGHFHPDPAMQKSGHCEARLLDGAANFSTPSTMTFSIDWRPRTGPKSRMPCKTCHDYLCQVQEDCDVKIFLCDNSKEPKKYQIPCPPTRKNRQAMKKALDGRKR